MDLKEWRAVQQKKAREEASQLTLPSGLSVLARRPDPTAVLSWGRLPLGLTAQATDEEESALMTKDQLLSNIEMTRQLLIYCLVSPRVSLDPRGDDEIHPREIPMSDVVFLARWAMRAEEAEELRPFRTE